MFRSIVALLVLPIVLGTASFSVQADPWKDESGHGYGRKHKGGDYKEEYWDGRCKVERKWEKNGEFKEERKCKDRPAAYHPPGAVYYPEPAIVISPQVVIRP